MEQLVTSNLKPGIIAVSNTSVREKIIAYKAGLKEQVLRKSKELGG